MTDPMLGGASVELDPTKVTNRDLSALSSGGIRNRHRPETTVTHRYAAQPAGAQRQAPGVNREMVIAGYKGKADAWIKCLTELLHVNGQQVQRSFYLALDPKEANRQGELMEIGSQAFQTFVVVPYRDALEANPVGLPAARNLHSFVGQVSEQYRNVGPVLIVLPFHTLMPEPFDFIERNYSHAISQKGITFLGYEVKKPEGRQPGAAIVLPPNWARHPDFPLAKGLSQYANGDISYIKDEILRSMRSSDVMIGDQMKPGATTAIQTFAADQVIDQQTSGYNPAGRPTAPVAPQATRINTPTPETTFPVQPVINPAQPIVYPVTPPARSFDADEKAATLVLISQLGQRALKMVDASRYGLTLAEDPEFADEAHKRNQGFKLRAGKKAKVN